MSGRKDLIDKKYEQMLENIKEGEFTAKNRKGVERVKIFENIEESQRVHENFITNFTAKEEKVKKIIVKASDYGSIETIQTHIAEIKDQYGVQHFQVLRYEVGTITENDLIECVAFDAEIYCMDITPSQNIDVQAKEERVPVYTYNIIYKLFEDLKNLNDNLSVEKNTLVEIKGSAQVQQIFEINLNKSIKLKVAGLKVSDGFFRKNMSFRLVRDGNVLNDELEAISLRKFKKEVRDLKGGDEGGISFKKCGEMMKGDVIECYVNK